MPNTKSIQYWNPDLEDASPYCIELLLRIDGAGQTSYLTNSSPFISTYSAWFGESTEADCQTKIDDFLGTSGEFPASAFKASNMGAPQAFAMLINMKGQAVATYGAEVLCRAQTNVESSMSGVCTAVPAFIDGPSNSQVMVGADGNIALRMHIGEQAGGGAGIQNVTAGVIIVRIYWHPI